MKKLFIFSILTYLFFTINSSALIQNSNEDTTENEKILKIGVLLPLSGKFQDTGQSFLKAIQLALFDIGNENIKIYIIWIILLFFLFQPQKLIFIYQNLKIIFMIEKY